MGTELARLLVLVGLLGVATAPTSTAQEAARVPPELPPASHPDFLLNRPGDDPLAGRFSWVPQPLFHGGPEEVGPLDADWVWPDLGLVDWDRDGRLDVLCTLGAGTYSHRPKDQQFRALVYRNTGRRRDGIPIFAEPGQVDLGYPLGSLAFGDLDGDGALDLVVFGRNLFRWYRDASRSGERRFAFVANLQDFGLHADLKPLEAVSMSPSLQLVDWDGDGRPDLIVGGRGGNLNYYPRKELGYGKGFAPDGTWVGGDRVGSVVVHKNLGVRDGTPCFATGRRLLAGEDERAVSSYDSATAVATDWDDDGRLDLVVAGFDALFWYPNTGTANEPRLGDGRRIDVAGRHRLPSERLMVIEANWDAGDRHNLILQGSSFPWYLRNEGGSSRPRFGAIETLLQEHPPVSAGDFAIPSAGDLDGDGRPDLVIGNEDGFLLYVRNTSPGALPTRFEPAAALEAGGSTFRVESGRGIQGPAERRWGYTHPVLVDWDGDRDLDLLVASLRDDVLYLENRGTSTHPAFAAPEPLRHGARRLAVAWRTRPVARDVDGDGLVDLLVLDPQGLLTLHRRTRAAGGRLELRPGEPIRDRSGAAIKLDGQGRETGRAMLTALDWDVDGRRDLVVGNAVENFDGLRWYRNVGTEMAWILERRPNLALNLPWNHYHLIEPIDWDRDGREDLVAGSEGGWIYFYRQR